MWELDREDRGSAHFPPKGIFPGWAVPAHGVLKYSRSPWVSLSAITASGCLCSASL